jgi:flavin reductase (DIM6/NTAB) family NADH-FMN oxidoreductase RutF
MQLTLSDLSPTQRYFVLSSLVVPRPIAWVTTLNEDGTVNAAPFSYFQLLGQEPPVIVLGFGTRRDGTAKDTYLNIRRSKEFVINMVTEENAPQMNLSSVDFPTGTSETAMLSLPTEPSVAVKPPRLAIAPAQLEGREIQTLLVGNNTIVMGELLVAHIRDEFIDAKTLRVHTEQMHLIGRLQGGEGGGYARTREPIFHKRLSYEEWLAQDKAQRG